MLLGFGYLYKFAFFQKVENRFKKKGSWPKFCAISFFVFSLDRVSRARRPTN